MSGISNNFLQLLVQPTLTTQKEEDKSIYKANSNAGRMYPSLVVIRYSVERAPKSILKIILFRIQPNTQGLYGNPQTERCS